LIVLGKHRDCNSHNMHNNYVSINPPPCHFLAAMSPACFLPRRVLSVKPRMRFFLDPRLCRFVPNGTRPRFDMLGVNELLLRTRDLCEPRRVEYLLTLDARAVLSLPQIATLARSVRRGHYRGGRHAARLKGAANA
jgi:hypothetical protein